MVWNNRNALLGLVNKIDGKRVGWQLKRGRAAFLVTFFTSNRCDRLEAMGQMGRAYLQVASREASGESMA